VAATVNDADVPIAEVEEQFESAKAQPQLAQQLEQDADGKLRKQVQAQILSQLIVGKLLEQWAEEEGVTATEEEIAEERATLVEQLGGEESFNAQVEQSGLSPEALNEEIRKIVLQNELSAEVAGDAEVSDEEIAAFYQENASRFGASARARHILVKTEAEAKRILKELQNGGDFAELAEAESTDKGSGAQGGDLGEFPQGQMVPAFDEAVFSAEAGDLVGPVKTDFGYHIIEVQEKTDAQELADVSDEIRAELEQNQQSQVFQERLQERSKTADVSVNPRFGTWNEETGQVDAEPPLGEATEMGGATASPGGVPPTELGTAPPPPPAPSEAATQ
jgi:parvulin-like peptidyl-prolyl isomerase